jgi:hypothetical protein
MNERIKELEQQCWSHRVDGALVDGQLHFDTQKFAELIVRECINIVEEQKECLHEEQKYWHDRDYGYALAVDDASNGIKQHFGVES